MSADALLLCGKEILDGAARHQARPGPLGCAPAACESPRVLGCCQGPYQCSHTPGKAWGDRSQRCDRRKLLLPLLTAVAAAPALVLVQLPRQRLAAIRLRRHGGSAPAIAGGPP